MGVRVGRTETAHAWSCSEAPQTYSSVSENNVPAPPLVHTQLWGKTETTTTKNPQLVYSQLKLPVAGQGQGIQAMARVLRNSEPQPFPTCADERKEEGMGIGVPGKLRDGEKQYAESWKTWLLVLALPRMSCVALDKLLNFPGPQFPY